MGGGGRLADRVPARLSAAEGRKFAFTVGGAFLVLAAITFWRAHPMASAVFGGLSGSLLLAGLLLPARLGPLHAAWMGLAHLLSKVTTPIFMGLVFFMVITPTRGIMRVFGKTPLRAPRGVDSYWITREPDARRSDLSRQF